MATIGQQVAEQVTRISTEVSEQTDLISQMNTALDDLGAVTGGDNSIPTVTQATPRISVSSGGLITASATQSAGYVAAGTKSATKQLTVQAAQTITPGTSNKTISSGRYLTGTQTIAGDANLTAGNIKSGVSIFGVDGTYEGSGGGTGGNAPFTGEFASITDNGMYEPGANEYVFDYSNCDVNLSAAILILLGGYVYGTNDYSVAVLKEDTGFFSTMSNNNSYRLNANAFSINQAAKTITAYGYIDSSGLSYLGFKAYFD